MDNRILAKFRSGEINLSATFRSGEINFPAKLGHTKTIFRPHSSHMETILRPHSGHTKSIFRSHSGYTKTVFRSHSGHTKPIFRSHSGHTRPMGGWTVKAYQENESPAAAVPQKIAKSGALVPIPPAGWASKWRGPQKSSQPTWPPPSKPTRAVCPPADFANVHRRAARAINLHTCGCPNSKNSLESPSNHSANFDKIFYKLHPDGKGP